MEAQRLEVRTAAIVPSHAVEAWTPCPWRGALRPAAARLAMTLMAGLPGAIAEGQSQLFGELHRMLPPDASGTRGVALGDVDGDLDLDALIGNSGQDGLYFNDGNGVFADASGNLPADSSNSFAVALGDVDGDLDLDALIGNFGQDRQYLNDGSGVFADATGNLPQELRQHQGRRPGRRGW